MSNDTNTPRCTGLLVAKTIDTNRLFIQSYNFCQILYQLCQPSECILNIIRFKLAITWQTASDWTFHSRIVLECAQVQASSVYCLYSTLIVLVMITNNGRVIYSFSVEYPRLYVSQGSLLIISKMLFCVISNGSSIVRKQPPPPPCHAIIVSAISPPSVWDWIHAKYTFLLPLWNFPFR